MGKFTKQHYEAIAEALNKAHRLSQGIPSGYHEAGVFAAESYLREMFEDDNPRFNIAKFGEACVK